MCQQVPKHPPDARRGPLEIADGDMADDCDTGFHNAAVGAHEIRHVSKANDAQDIWQGLVSLPFGTDAWHQAARQTILTGTRGCPVCRAHAHCEVRQNGCSGLANLLRRRDVRTPNERHRPLQLVFRHRPLTQGLPSRS